MRADDIERLYEEHDTIKDNHPRLDVLSDRGDPNTWLRQYVWQKNEYDKLLSHCVAAGGANQRELKQAVSLLKNAAALVRDGDVRLATARQDQALQLIHNWLQRVRAEAKGE